MPNPQEYVSSLFGVAGKSVVVTGAADGLGKAISKAFANAGALVTLADFDADRLEATTDELLRISPDILSERVDVTSEEQVDALVDTAMERFGAIDVLVNNAGAMLGTVSPETYPLHLWQATVAVNLTGLSCVRGLRRA